MSPQEAGRRLTVAALPGSWFGRPQYRPRLRTPQADGWFLLSPSFAPARRVPDAPPAEPECGRAALREAFEETRTSWDLPRTPTGEQALASIAEEGTAVVVTGQQPGFLGGPLLTLYKALTAVAAARHYRALTGRKCVPVFWVASEDHDLDEVRTAYLPGPPPGEVPFRYPHDADRRPLSLYPIDAAARGVIQAAQEHLGNRRFGDEARALLDLYGSRGLAGGFAAILVSLLGPTGLLVIDPEKLRPLAPRVFRRAIERPEDVLACVERGRRDVRSRGLEPIVSGRFPLFLLEDGKRHHLSLTTTGLEIDGGGPPLSRDRLLRTLEETPRAFSTGALLRPLLAQATLPCVLTVGGPAEVGYFAQLGPLVDYFEVPKPEIGLRLNATIVDGKFARLAGSIPPERLAAARSPEELLAKEDLPVTVKALKQLAPAVESGLLDAVKVVAEAPEAKRLKSRASGISGDILRFADRIEKVLVERRGAELDAARKLWDFVFPEGELQERRWGFIHFIAKHGTDWLEDVLEALEPDPLAVTHRWIVFE